MSKSVAIKAACITGAATILAAVVGGLFLFLRRESDNVRQETRGSSQSIQVGRDLNIANVGSDRPGVAPSSVALFPFELQVTRAKERIKYLADEYLRSNVMSLVEVTGPYGDNVLDSPNLYDWTKVIEELERQGYVKILKRTQKNFEFAYTGKAHHTPPPPMPSKTQPKRPVPPSKLTQQTGPSREPQSKLDRLIEKNGRLSEGDRARLTNALFEFAEALSQANALWGRANQAGARLNQAWQDGSIAKDFDAHKNTLSAINSSAKELKQSFPQLRDKWKFYADQTNYIFGDNPDNEGPNTIINAVEGYSNYLDRWIKIQNKEDRSVLDLFDTEQREFNERIRGFALWKQDCERRLEQMKKSIQ